MTKTLAQIKNECSIAANESKRDYRKDNRDGVLFSRGRFLNVLVADEHSNTRSVVDGESWQWDGTMADIHRCIEMAKKDFPTLKVVEVQIFGGYDYADSVVSYYKDVEYEPLVAEWQVIIPANEIPFRELNHEKF